MNVELKPSENIVEPHILPCRIAYNGKANVSRYFIVTEGENGLKHATFRGRALQGAKVALPEGYTAHIHQMPTVSEIGLTHDENGYENVEPTESQAMASFKGFILWNHNAPPSMHSDKLVGGLQKRLNLAAVDTVDGENEEETDVTQLQVLTK